MTRIAYLVNQYPKVSHTFIRREIRALELCGLEVLRFSQRRCSEELVDELDAQELLRTRTILDVGATRLIGASLRVLLASPGRALRALALAIRLGWRSDRGLLRHLAYWAEGALLRDWLCSAGVEHLHAHFASNPAAVAMFCRILGGPPFSFTVHGPDDLERARYLGLDEKVKRASFVVTVSHYGRGQLSRCLSPALWPKVVLVRCGVDETFLEHREGEQPEGARLTCIARLHPDKGHWLLLAALRKLADENVPCDVTLVGDGESRSMIEAEIDRLGLRERVTMAGWVSGTSVRGHILASRATVLPSLAENLPLALVESLALRRPVIATCVGAIPELVEPGVNGWLVPSGSVEALAEAMHQAVSAPAEMLGRMGQAGAERVRRWHSTATEGAKLAELIRESLSGVGKRTA